jgi:LacI family transcriptional regulator
MKRRAAEKPQRPTVALLVESSSAFGRELLRGILSYVREHDVWSIQLPDNEPGYEQLASFSSGKPDGCIARIVDGRMARRLRHLHIPVVDVGGDRDLSNGCWVGTNHERLVQIGVDHLFRRGFRHVAFCGDPRFEWSNLRERIFKKYAKGLGLDVSACRAGTRSKTPPSWKRLSATLQSWLHSLPKPVGILASHDLRGQQLLNACRLAEIDVPAQAAVLGVDNDEVVCNLCKPPLSSIVPNAFRSGYVAAELLNSMLTKRLKKPIGVEVEPERIERRASTDVLVFEDRIVRDAMQIIRRHACDGLKVVDVVRRMRVSRRTLDSHFVEALGRTPHDELLRLRLERVKELLLETSLPVAAIARRAGFEREEYMNVAFKRTLGVTPGAYRRNRGGGADMFKNRASRRSS